MIETFLFVLVLYVLLWPYFIMLGVMDFKKDPNTMEDHIPGRPARRTIGRKNDDVSKALLYILVGHSIVCLSFYGLLNFKDVFSNIGLGVVAFGGLSIAMFLFSPANRLAHAYIKWGNIAVVHVVCAIASFIAVTAIIYDYALTMDDFKGLALILLGALLCFGSKSKPPKKKTDNEGEF